MNAARADFHLSASSPAIDCGSQSLSIDSDNFPAPLERLSIQLHQSIPSKNELPSQSNLRKNT